MAKGSTQLKWAHLVKYERICAVCGTEIGRLADVGQTLHRAAGDQCLLACTACVMAGRMLA